MKKVILLVLILLVIPIAFAKTAHMPLLAVKEKGAVIEGSVADLYLDISPGTGRVFIETFPLTKVDTQISTRFAKDVACSYLNINCNQYDFFYTIKADSPIVGGPSAGAATAVLTASSLLNLEISESTAITGTINAGGLIGPVGGLREKIDAAETINVTGILIPEGELTQEIDNITVDLVEYAENRGIALAEVSNLNDAIYYFTGKRIKKPKETLIIDENYEKTMAKLAKLLCDRSQDLEEQLNQYEKIRLAGNDSMQALEKAQNLTQKGKQAFEDKQYYSSASYCFGASVKFRYLILKLKNRVDTEKLQQDIDAFNENLEGTEIKTLTDLEAYMVVKERLQDAQDNLDNAKKTNETIEKTNHHAYATERIYSAYSWAEFFGKPGKEFELDRESLKEGCLSKISEAEERYQYAKIFFENELEKTKQELEYAYRDLEEAQYELCIFRAAKTKAEADALLGLIGVEEKQLPTFIESKLDIVKQILIEEQEKGIFPILGYSYYEYANSLKEDDPFASLLYLEYALELSNLDMYFKPAFEIIPEAKQSLELNIILIFLFGAVFGFAISYLIKIKRPKKRKTSRR
jgi:uncharacterized protein